MPDPRLDTYKGPRLQPDPSQAARHLKLLDPHARFFTFQVFTDDKRIPRGNRLARILHGTLAQHAVELAALNQRGCGIFVTVNETDGKGRRIENVVRIRAVWQEADRGDEPRLPLEPQIEIESSADKFHRYLLVDNLGLDEFNGTQQRLVDDYGSDPNAADRARVLRLAGFFHLKDPGKPWMVRIVGGTGEGPYPASEIRSILPQVSPERMMRRQELPATGTPLDEEEKKKIRGALDSLDPDMEYGDWLAIGMALHATGAGREAFELWGEWSSKGAKWQPGACSSKWGTFNRDRAAGAVTIGSLFHMAQEAGWTGLRQTPEEAFANPPPAPPIPVETVADLIPEELRSILMETVDRTKTEWSVLRRELREKHGVGLGMLDTWRQDLKREKARESKQVAAAEKAAKAARRAQEEEERRARSGVVEVYKPGYGQQRFDFARGLIESRSLQTRTIAEGLEQVQAYPSNVRTILQAGARAGVYPAFKFNELTNQAELAFQGATRAAEDHHYDKLLAHLCRDFDAHFARETVVRQAEALGREASYHPVRQYLDTLAWDGVSRLDTWLHTAVGCPDDVYHRAVGRLLVVAAVKRVLEPGCFLRFVVILGGDQNLGKTSLLKNLAGREDWHLETGINPQDIDRTVQTMHRGWIVEVGELKGFRRAATEDIKQMISRSKDTYRRAYARQETTEPRAFVIVGTTNESEYLNDHTGGTRYLPVQCERADYGWVGEHHGQLLAEAAVRVQIEGALPMLPDHLMSEAARIQEQHREVDDWEHRIEEALERILQPPGDPPRTFFVQQEIYPALDVTTAQGEEKRFQMRVAKCLYALGYRRSRERLQSGGKLLRGWKIPSL